MNTPFLGEDINPEVGVRDEKQRLGVLLATGTPQMRRSNVGAGLGGTPSTVIGFQEYKMPQKEGPLNFAQLDRSLHIRCGHSRTSATPFFNVFVLNFPLEVRHLELLTCGWVFPMSRISLWNLCVGGDPCAPGLFAGSGGEISEVLNQNRPRADGYKEPISCALFAAACLFSWN